MRFDIVIQLIADGRQESRITVERLEEDRKDVRMNRSVLQ